MQKLLDYFYRALLGLGALFMIATLMAILLGIAGRQFGFDIPGLDGCATATISG
jgi:TRAP-type C4-dicarboxylate transport system permease small subunit